MTHSGINGTSESDGTNSEEGWGLFLATVSAEVKATQSEEAKNVCVMRDVFLRGCCSLVHVFMCVFYLWKTLIYQLDIKGWVK